ncbi:MAG: hypothetical protein NZ108_02230, partial [Bacteroidia bacterium]|nr:hypothetical protein [Bacteroidia bacterium]
MKKILAFFCVSLSIGILPAQTLTGDFFATPNDTVVYQQYDVTTMNQGSSGQSQTWNFSTVPNFVGAIDTTFWIQPNSLPGSSSFPDATHGTIQYLDAILALVKQYAFWEITPNVVRILGFHQPFFIFTGSGLNAVALPQTYVNPNPDTLAVFPMTFNQSRTFSRVYQRVEVGTAFPMDTLVTRAIQRTVTYDGNGTLITPNATFSNVIRLHMFSTFKDTIFIPIQGNPVAVATQEITSNQYTWYQEGVGEVHRYFNNLINNTLGTNTSIEARYLKSIVTSNSIVSEKPVYHVYPNPANQVLWLQGLLPGETVTLRIL